MSEQVASQGASEGVAESRGGPLGRAGVTLLALAGLVGVSWPFAVSTLQDAVTGAPFDGATPTRPLAYLVGAPLFGVWDSLSLLPVSQHYAIVVTLVALWVALRAGRARSRHAAGSARGSWTSRLLGVGRELALSAAALLALLLFYVCGLLIPRPMVGMALADPELLSIDFHSHTEYSHDGWALFSARRNRAWHVAGGFDVGYVTDHYTWRGYDEAAADNPERLGGGTVLLEGAEIRIHQRPTNILGARDRYLPALDADSLYMDPDLLRAQAEPGSPPATLLYTMPGHLQYVVPFGPEEPAGVIGIEINDGSPRGLEQVRSQRAQILALADSVDLALLGAANLHGWGRTVASWSVMRIPGWRELRPEEAGDAIEELLHRERRAAVSVVERRMPYHAGSQPLLVLTLPWLTWEHFRMLGVAERISWLLWLVVVGGLLARRHRRRLARVARGA